VTLTLVRGSSFLPNQYKINKEFLKNNRVGNTNVMEKAVEYLKHKNTPAGIYSGT
jgi:hypothetical protein